MIDAEVVEVRPDTSIAATIALAAPGFAHKPGQWIRIDPHQFPSLAGPLKDREQQRGKPEGPAYFAMSSDGLSPGRLEITVKLSDRPGGSPLPEHLVRGLRPGARVSIDGPGGTYGYPEPLPAGLAGVIHVCAGSGVAPNRGLIRHALGKGWPLRHLLVLQDRSPDTRLFRAEWEALDASEPERFRLRGVHSRSGEEYVCGDVITEAARGYVDPTACLAMICGPSQPRGTSPSFVELAKGSLQAAGVPADRLFVA